MTEKDPLRTAAELVARTRNDVLETATEVARTISIASGSEGSVRDGLEKFFGMVPASKEILDEIRSKL